MYNPFVPFDLRLLNALYENGRRYYVHQNFPRGANPFLKGFKASILITDCKGFDEAARHLKSLRRDPIAFIYDITLPEHRQRLEIAANGVPSYDSKLYQLSLIPFPLLLKMKIYDSFLPKI
jgi:hypothetical protein